MTLITNSTLRQQTYSIEELEKNIADLNMKTNYMTNTIVKNVFIWSFMKKEILVFFVRQLL